MFAQQNSFEPIIVDNFAGGGGASTGIELATGRIVNIAINHDAAAILMHRTNHPHTEHLQADIWDVDPEKVCRGRHVGLAWFSPDCKHFSKAKGAALLDRNIRGLAWIELRWAAKVRPDLMITENVEEFLTWGPLNRRHHPIKSKAGTTFARWVAQLLALGYEVEWSVLNAADYGAPTSRRRLVIIARCDGKPIVWPERTHAPRDSKEVESGKCMPWRSAAEIIDWSLPCPSVFDSKAEILERYGLKAVRPLADNTLRRIIRGVDKFTIRSGKPFIVPTGYGERKGQAPRVHDIDTPLPTAVSTVKHNVCEPKLAPFLADCNHSGGGHITDAEAPLGTITRKCTAGIVLPLMAPVTFSNTNASVGAPADQPIHTIRTGGGGGQLMSAAQLIQYHTEQTENVRAAGLNAPINTVDASNRYGLTTANLVEYYSTGRPLDIAGPMHTATSHDREALVCAHICKFKGDNVGESAHAPMQTVTAGGGEFAAVSSICVKYAPGSDLRHWPEICTLLNRYCGYTIADDEVLLIPIGGKWYYIADIGLRMLSPRELYRAMGFPEDYKIDTDYLGNPYPKTEQVARCGNAVCPPMAAAVVRANWQEVAVWDIVTMAELERRVAI